ncbi:hypothetical protein NC652_004613 [Populus alba x Populus x berolinensis]|nr:hypothetical protein NC652_004613 [Populus alba x Populus x berolinensis]
MEREKVVVVVGLIYELKRGRSMAGVEGRREDLLAQGEGKWRWGRESLSGSGSWGKRMGNGAD